MKVQNTHKLFSKELETNYQQFLIITEINGPKGHSSACQLMDETVTQTPPPCQSRPGCFPGGCRLPQMLLCSQRERLRTVTSQKLMGHSRNQKCLVCACVTNDCPNSLKRILEADFLALSVVTSVIAHWHFIHTARLTSYGIPPSCHFCCHFGLKIKSIATQGQRLNHFAAESLITHFHVGEI